MKFQFFPLFILLLLLISCGGQEPPLNNIAQQELEAYQNKYDDLIGFINLVETDLEDIVERQGELDATIQTGDFKNQSQMDRIRNNINQLDLALQKANQKVSDYEARMKKQGRLIVDLKKTIDRYKKQLQMKTAELEAARTRIATLETQLADEQRTVEAQKQQLEILNQSLANTNGQLKAKSGELAKSNQELKASNNRIKKLTVGYYDYGTGKDLKKKGIINNRTTNQEKQELEHDYASKLTKRIDIDEQSIIELTDAPGDIATILPKRPVNSYKVKGKKLTIIDPAVFWDRSKNVVLITEKK